MAVANAAPARDPAGLLEKGRLAFAGGQFDHAEVLFRAALDAGADPMDCRRHLARIYNRQQDWQRALEQWQWLERQQPNTLEPRLQVARGLFRFERFGEAAAEYRRVLELDGNHPEAKKRLEFIDGLSAAEIASGRRGEYSPASPTGKAAAPADKAAPYQAANFAKDTAAAFVNRNDKGPTASGASIAAASGDATVRTLVGRAREAFRRQDLAYAESLFKKALREGAEEPVCHLHLGRIYNQLNDWPLALEQWQWLQAHDPRQVEPNLQVARALHRLGRLPQAAASFRAVLQLRSDHAEAIQRLQQIEAVLSEESKEDPARESWLSLVPEPLRWRLAADLLGGGIGNLEALIGQVRSHAEALNGAVAAVAEAGGPLGSQRQLYGVQTARAIEDLVVDLKEAGNRVRDLSRRAEKLFDTFERSTGNAVAPLRSVRDVPRSVVRDKVEQLVGTIREDRGIDAALAVLYREAPTEERSALLSSLGVSLRDSDRANAIRMFWLAYGADTSPNAARRAAVRLYMAGDLSGAAALLEGRPSEPVTGVRAASNRAMESTLALFRNGLSIPPRAERRGAVKPNTLGYVASGSLPFQIAGYTVRTQALLDSLPAAGIQPFCFTQPGFPWDRPQLLPEGQSVPAESVVGGVRYRHTPWPEETDPKAAVETAAGKLATLFRDYAIETVQAASNSRNALPALMAARAVGAKFVYEVRGLWELTAAARFAGWETTERYHFDRELEVRIATEADHVLTITRGVADELIGGGVPPERISLLPNAVDPELFGPMPRDAALATRLGIRDEDFVVVYAGSLSSYEGLDDLIEAGALMSREGISFRLVLAGDGEFRGELEAAASAKGQAGNVIFTGRLPPEEVRSHLSLAHAVAIPRKPHRVCQVVSPLKPFEAMSMEKAVILSDLPVLREIVKHEQTGLLCKPENARDLANQLFRLARDRVLRERLGRAARQWILAERSWAHNARTLRTLYADLNGRRSRAGEAI